MAFAVPRQQVASFAMQISKTNMRSATKAMPLARRYFSSPTDNPEEVLTESAEKAAEEGGSTVQGSSPLQSSPTESERARQGHSIFVSNMTFDATDMHLREAFSKYGEITSINIGRDGRGLSRGFGFITFTDKDAADRACAEAHKSFWHGRRINVEPKKPSSDGVRRPSRDHVEPTTSLYIGNIPYETSDADLNRLFRELNNVTDVRVAVDRNTGWPRGFAHADFTDVESAKAAYEKVGETSLGGRQLRVDYSQKRTGNFDRSNRP